MRTTALSAIICLMLAIARHDVFAQQSPDRAADAAAIRKHIEGICQAFVDKDRAKLEATHGRDWRGFTPWSDHVIRGLDGYMNEATFAPGTPKGEGMVGFKLSDFDVVFYGDTAVASFILEVDRVEGGEKSTHQSTLLDVYHKGADGWIQVASNTSLHAAEVDRLMSVPRRVGPQERAQILEAREAVWRAWFAGDTTRLTTLVPPELITLEDSDDFGNRASTIEGSRGFAKSGGKLTRLVFPRTELQAYGQTVILYTTYEMDLTEAGQTRTDRGVATEVFVRQNGKWVNTGWQLARRR
jgi:ketosteroid isomerase-like protein